MKQENGDKHKIKYNILVFFEVYRCTKDRITESPGSSLYLIKIFSIIKIMKRCGNQ